MPRIGKGSAAFLAIGGVAGALLVANISGSYRPPEVAVRPMMVRAAPTNALLEQLLADSLLGRSGRLRARFVPGMMARAYPTLGSAFSEHRGHGPIGVPHVNGDFSFLPLVPFAEKFGDRVGTYLVGYWPGEKRKITTDEYQNPAGFIEVTAENAGLYVSDHFRLSDFVTHDQQVGWPKYLVLQEALLDKLELVIEDLARRGVRVVHVRVLSGFRTPYHNEFGIGSEGGARDSRHQYGDAADIIIDNNRDGRMDDLNGDRRVDSHDVDIVLKAVERVEKAYPELVGGLGKYDAIGPSGPFAHIDVRGYRARWNNSARPAAAVATSAALADDAVQDGQAVRISGCWSAPGTKSLCGKGQK